MAGLDIGRDKSSYVSLVLKLYLKALLVNSLFIDAHRTSH